MIRVDLARLRAMTDSLAVIGAEVRACRMCKLSRTRTVGVPGEGDPNAEIMFIGEGPGFHEDQQGRPFVGAAGQLLTEMLALIGLRRENVFITNVVRCRPPGNRDPLPDELSACDTYTLRQVDVLKPKLIVTLGRFSMARFFGPGPMRELHGRSREWNGITCLAMYHPAAILRTPTVEMRRIYADDFARIPALLADARARRDKQAVIAAAAAAELALELELTRQLDQLPLF
jgi:uracil-DNA glycosylase family 4